MHFQNRLLLHGSFGATGTGRQHLCLKDAIYACVFLFPDWRCGAAARAMLRQTFEGGNGWYLNADMLHNCWVMLHKDAGCFFKNADRWQDKRRRQAARHCTYLSLATATMLGRCAVFLSDCLPCLFCTHICIRAVAARCAGLGQGSVGDGASGNLWQVGSYLLPFFHKSVVICFLFKATFGA